MKSLNTITIGIPAFNEEANIKLLLSKLLRQKEDGFIVKKIIIVSDESSDNTVKLSRSIKDSKIKVVDRKIRLGAKKTQNEIIKLTKSDILLMLDADVLPIGNNFISHIVKPILADSEVGLVGADTISAKPRSFLESIIADSHELKKNFYKRINKTDNLYLCHGRARAFSQKLYSQMNWPDGCPEDAYSYLYNKIAGFKFVFAQKAKVLFRSPSLFSDHEKQSSRFLNGKKNLERFFSKGVVEEEFYIPWTLKFKSVWKFFLKKPVSTVSYLVIYLYIKFFCSKKYVDHGKWDVAWSSKRIIYEN